MVEWDNYIPPTIVTGYKNIWKRILPKSVTPTKAVTPLLYSLHHLMMWHCAVVMIVVAMQCCSIIIGKMYLQSVQNYNEVLREAQSIFMGEHPKIDDEPLRRPPSKSLLYNLLDNCFKHVKIPLPKNWGLCSTCAKHTALMKRGFSVLAAKEKAIVIHRAHVLLHKSEREQFNYRWNLAIRNSEHILIIHGKQRCPPLVRCHNNYVDWYRYH